MQHYFKFNIHTPSPSLPLRKKRIILPTVTIIKIVHDPLTIEYENADSDGVPSGRKRG